MKLGVKRDGTSVRKGMGRRVGCGTFVIVSAVNCSVQHASQSSGMGFGSSSLVSLSQDK